MSNERVRESKRKYYHSEKGQRQQRNWKKKNPDKVKKHWTTWNSKPTTKEYKRIHARDRVRKLRKEVIEYYGGSPPKCSCCGETIFEFLCIDHVNGGGCQQRKRLGLSSGSSFYAWLKRNHFPSGYQVLCANCNQGKQIRGQCPHSLSL